MTNKKGIFPLTYKMDDTSPLPPTLPNGSQNIPDTSAANLRWWCNLEPESVLWWWAVEPRYQVPTHTPTWLNLEQGSAVNHPVFLASNNKIKPDLSEKQTPEHTSAWLEQPMMSEIVWENFSFCSVFLSLALKWKVCNLCPILQPATREWDVVSSPSGAVVSFIFLYNQYSM